MTLIRLCQFAAHDIHGLMMLCRDHIVGNQPLEASHRVIAWPAS